MPLGAVRRGRCPFNWTLSSLKDVRNWVILAQQTTYLVVEAMDVEVVQTVLLLTGLDLDSPNSIRSGRSNTTVWMRNRINRLKQGTYTSILYTLPGSATCSIIPFFDMLQEPHTKLNCALLPSGWNAVFYPVCYRGPSALTPKKVDPPPYVLKPCRGASRRPRQ